MQNGILDERGKLHDAKGRYTNMNGGVTGFALDPNLNSAIGESGHFAKAKEFPNQNAPLSEGYPLDMKMKDLKKLSGVAAGLVMASALTACAANGPEATTEPPTSTTEPSISTEAPTITQVNQSNPSDLVAAEVSTELGAVFTSENDAVAARAELAKMSPADPAREGKWVIQRTDAEGNTHWEIIKDLDYHNELWGITEDNPEKSWANVPEQIIPAWNLSLAEHVMGNSFVKTLSWKDDGSAVLMNYEKPSGDFIATYVNYIKGGGQNVNDLWNPGSAEADAVVGGFNLETLQYANRTFGFAPRAENKWVLVFYEATGNSHGAVVEDTAHSGIKSKAFRSKQEWVEYWSKVADQHRDDPSFVVWGPDGRL